MAATTLATSIGLMGESLNKELFTEFFVTPDPCFARMPFQLSDLNWRQLYTSAPTGAAAKGYFGSMTSSAFTQSYYDGFLNEIYKQDDRTLQLYTQRGGYTGQDDRLTKRRVILEALSKLAREYAYVGNPVDVTIGANVSTLLGAAAAIEAGPRLAGITDVHAAAGATTTEGLLKWDTTAKTLQFKMSGDSSWGSAVTMSATNFWRVPLFDSSGTRWIRLTCTWATLTGQGNFTGDTGAGNHIDFAPNYEPTGLLTQVHPTNVVFGNLSATNPTATGDAVSQKNMSWLATKLLDSSNEDPGRCAILMDTTRYLNAESIITALATGSQMVDFMGSKLQALSYRGIPIIRCPWLPTNTGSNGTTTGLGTVLGVVLGEDRCFVRYNSTASDPTSGTAAAVESSASVQGQLPAPVVLPVHYREIGEGSTTETVTMRATMLYEPVVSSYHAAAALLDVV